jgi:hypothetical protein
LPSLIEGGHNNGIVNEEPIEYDGLADEREKIDNDQNHEKLVKVDSMGAKAARDFLNMRMACSNHKER